MKLVISAGIKRVFFSDPYVEKDVEPLHRDFLETHWVTA